MSQPQEFHFLLSDNENFNAEEKIVFPYKITKTDYNFNLGNSFYFKFDGKTICYGGDGIVDTYIKNQKFIKYNTCLELTFSSYREFQISNGVESLKIKTSCDVNLHPKPKQHVM